MRTSNDALRSLKRYLSLALPGYDLRFDGEEGTGKRPGGVITAASPEQITGPQHSSDHIEAFTVYIWPAAGSSVMDSRLKAGEVKETLHQLFAMGLVGGERADGGVGRRMLVPLYDYDEKTLKEGAADYAESRLAGAVTIPTTPINITDATDFAAEGILYLGITDPQLLTYTGKSGNQLTGVSGGEGAIPANTLVRQYGDRRAPDYARIQDLTLHVQQSPDDQLLYTVLAEVRLGWRRGALLPSDGEMAESVRISFD